MRFTRRRLLVGGVAAIAIGGATEVRRATARDPGAHALSSRELAIVGAIATAMFPGAPFPVDGLEAGVPAEVDRLVAEVLAPIHATGFRTLLQTLEWGTLASRGTPFSALSLTDRAEVLELWLTPDVFTRRLAADSFRIILGMAYFSHPAVLDHIGWRTECRGGAT